MLNHSATPHRGCAVRRNRTRGPDLLISGGTPINNPLITYTLHREYMSFLGKPLHGIKTHQKNNSPLTQQVRPPDPERD